MPSGHMPTASEVLDLLDRLGRDPDRRSELRMGLDIHRACVAEGLLNLDCIDWLAWRMQELHNEGLIAHGAVSGGVFEPPVWDDYWLQSVHDWRVTAAGRADAALYRQRTSPESSAGTTSGSSGRAVEPGHAEHDVFISHAGEDKEAVARPLAAALTARGWKVWLDELELTVGDSLSGRIDAALAQSRFGVVVLSPAFFTKEWPQRELAGLAAREVDAGAKVILPVWHNVDRSYLAARSPVLADRLGALSSAGIEDVATRLSLALERAGQRATDDNAAQPVLRAVASSTASDLGFPLGVPTSDAERERLLSARPRGWEHLLFAGVLLEGKSRLKTKWHDHELRIPGGERRAFDSGAAVIAFVRRETRWVVDQLAARMRVLDPASQERAWGAPGAPADQDHLQHIARHIVTTYELLMDWAASIRNTSVPVSCFDLLELTARMVDQPIRQVREFIDSVVEEFARVPEVIAQRAPDDPPHRIELILEVAPGEGVLEALPEALEKVEQDDYA